MLKTQSAIQKIKENLKKGDFIQNSQQYKKIKNMFESVLNFHWKRPPPQYKIAIGYNNTMPLI